MVSARSRSRQSAPLLMIVSRKVRSFLFSSSGLMVNLSMPVRIQVDQYFIAS